MYVWAMMNVNIFTHFHCLITYLTAGGEVLKMLLWIITEVLANPMAYNDCILLNTYLKVFNFGEI